MSYRKILMDIFESRKIQNPSYSIAAFSRDAGYKSYHISDIIKGRYGLSTSSAAKVAKNLKMPTDLYAEFMHLVELEYSKSPIANNIALEKLEKLRYTIDKKIDLNDFDALSEWYYFAIAELARHPSFLPEEKYISKKLGITEEQSIQAISKLKQYGILVKNKRGDYSVSHEMLSVSSNTPSKSIRNFHKAMLKKSLDSIEAFSINERHLTSFNALLTKEEYNLLSNELSAYVQNFIHKIQKNPKNSSRLYAINIQLHPYSKDI